MPRSGCLALNGVNPNLKKKKKRYQNICGCGTDDSNVYGTGLSNLGLESILVVKMFYKNDTKLY